MKDIDDCSRGEAQILLHLAAKSPPHSARAIIESNVNYLEKVIDRAKALEIQNFIFFSAASIYGLYNGEDLEETSSWVLPNAYGISKALGEKMLQESGLNVLSLRLPAILGFRNRNNLMMRISDKLIKNERITLFNADRIFNNFIDVDTIFQFIIGVENLSGFDVINLASKKEMTLLEVTKLLHSELNSSAEIVCLEDSHSFFNISTKKAEQRYGFRPPEANRILQEWARKLRSFGDGFA